MEKECHNLYVSIKQRLRSVTGRDGRETQSLLSACDNER